MTYDVATMRARLARARLSSHVASAFAALTDEQITYVINCMSSWRVPGFSYGFWHSGATARAIRKAKDNRP